MPRNGDQRRCCDRISVVALLSFAFLAPGCTGGGGIGAPTAASAPPPAPTSSSSSYLPSSISSFFSGSSANSPQPVAGAQTPDVSCPYLDIRQGASTLTIGPSGDNAAMGLKYQGTFVRAARECSVVAGQMVMRVGVEGRIVLGPAGGPGQVNVPLRLAVVDEKPASSQVIVTRFILVPVTVQSSDDNPVFTHIEEGLSFPLPPAGELARYIVYIGFDPVTAEAQDKQKERPKPRPRGKPAQSN